MNYGPFKTCKSIITTFSKFYLIMKRQGPDLLSAFLGLHGEDQVDHYTPKRCCKEGYVQNESQKTDMPFNNLEFSMLTEHFNSTT